MERYTDSLVDEAVLAQAHERATIAVAADRDMELERGVRQAWRSVCGGKRFDHARVARGLALQAALYAAIVGTPSAAQVAECASGAMAWAVAGLDDATRHTAIGAEFALHCRIIGNFFDPFRPVSIEPSLLTANGGLIPSLAQAAYEHRQLPAGTLDPARLMVLADAVEEGGGADELVAHLRSPGPKVRGDWALDCLLGKQ